MRCLVACYGSEVHIELKDVIDDHQEEHAKEEENEDRSSDEATFRETVYYEVDRPSALGGVDKLYRAARGYGLKRTQVLNWLWQHPGYTLHKPAREHFCRNRVIVFDIDSQWQADFVDLQHFSR